MPPGFQKDIYESANKGMYRNRKDGSNSWEHIKERGEILINYQSIPAPTLTKYDLPEPAALARRKMEALVQVSHEAREYFLSSPQVFEIADELAEQASWLIFLASTSARAARSIGYNSIDELYEDAMKVMACKPWTRWKCNSLQVLKRKLKPFNTHIKKGSPAEDAYKSLISGKYGNSNSQKLTEDQEALIIQIAANTEGVKLNWTQVHWHYIQQATKMVDAYKASNGAHGWSDKCLVSASTVKQFIHRPDISQIIYKKRNGRKEYRDKYIPVTKRERPSRANAVWVIDGTPLHRYFYDYDKNYAYAKLNVFTVIDAYSWCPIGFYISQTEDTNAVIKALWSACQVTGCLPEQIIMDNSSAIKSWRAQECMGALTHRLIAAEAGNARAKIIEPFFKMFNEQVLKYRTGYTGSPVMAKSITNQPNQEQLSKWVKDKALPSVDQAVQETIEDYTLFQNRVMPSRGKSPLQMYKQSCIETADDQRKFTRRVEVAAFFEMPGQLKKVKVMEGGKQRMLNQFIPQDYNYTNKGISLRVDGQQHDFMTDSPEFNAQHIGDVFNVKYDPRDASVIYLYKDGKPFYFNDEHLAIDAKDVFHMALIDREEGEAQRLADHLDKKKRQEELVDMRYSSAIQNTIEQGTHRPVITANAFDKEAMNEAKSQRLEQLINGDDYNLTEDNSQEADDNNDVQHNPIDRWDLED